MLSKNLCIGLVALLFVPCAYPQVVAPAASGASGQNQPPPQPATFDSGAVRPGVAQPAEVTRSNPDPAAQRIDREFERHSDTFIAPPTKIEIQGSGIALPSCVSESQEGTPCK